MSHIVWVVGFHAWDGEKDQIKGIFSSHTKAWDYADRNKDWDWAYECNALIKRINTYKRIREGKIRVRQQEQEWMRQHRHYGYLHTMEDIYAETNRIMDQFYELYKYYVVDYLVDGV